MSTVAVAYSIALVVCLLAARRHAVQTGAPAGVVLRAAAGVAAVAVLPVAVAAAVGARPWDAGEGAALVAFPLALLQCARFLRPPVGLSGTRDALPPVDDPALLERIEELSRRSGLEAPPVVRLLRTHQTNLSALAFAGGLFRPTLIVTDGIVHRLDPDERDAIVAHELAHLSTGSIRGLTLAAGVGWAAAVPFVADLPFLVALLVLANVQAIVHRLVQRRVEIVCDREAAEVVGGAPVAAGLGKIHRVHAVPERGALPLLFHATATHPHHAVRAAALAEAEAWPRSEDPARRRDLTARARPHRLASAVLFALWGGAVVAAVRLGGRPELLPALTAVLLALLVHPVLLLVAVTLKRARRDQRRVGFRLRATRWMRAGLVAGVAGYAILWFPWSYDFVGLLLVLPAAVVIVVAAVALRGPARLRNRVGAPLQRHAWAEAIAVAEAEPARLARDPALQHDVALCRALLGDRSAAISDLERILAAWPRLHVARISLGLLLLTDEPAAALARGDELAAALGGDPVGPLLRGRALVRLGRLDDARSAVEEALAIDPEEASAYTTLVSVHLARGEVEAAAEACRRAFELQPGAAGVRLARARLAVASESREQARRLVAEAVEAAEAAPFSFLVDEARELEAALDARVDAGPLIG